MKYTKMLALAAVAAAALMAFVGVGTASATTLTNEAGEVVKTGSTIDFSIPSGKSAVLVDTTGEELDSCSGTSTVKGKTTNEGGTGVAVAGNVETLEWNTCTFPTKTITKSGLQVNGTASGNVSATGTFEVTINTIFFGSCIYGVTGGTSIGTLASGTFTANAVAEKFSGSNLACPSTSRWTGTYTATEPKGLKVDA